MYSKREEEGVERIPGPHCYAFFSGNEAFKAREDDDMTSFFLTDYLARHFDKLIWNGMGLDRHPLGRVPTLELED